ncbi:MAG: C4-dicarboxylate ABC transporter, partial [Rhodospirillales bacterium]|nr:C4-dicarboxylate ABC transporter [Rhodospirillales bacterium]
DQYSASLQKLKKDHGVNVYRTDEAILKAQLASWDTVMEDLTKDPFFKKVADSQKAWAHRVAYYDLQASADFKLAFNHHFPKELGF